MLTRKLCRFFREISGSGVSEQHKVLMASDAASKQKTAAALDRDLAAMKVHLNGAACEAAYDEAADKIKAMTTRR